MFSMTLGVTIVSHKLARGNLRSVALRRRFPAEMFAETPFSVHYTLEADSDAWGPAGFTIFENDPVTPVEAPPSVPPIPAGEARAATGRWVVSSRGEHHLGSAKLASSFPFGLAEYCTNVGTPLTVIVFPKIELLETEITSRLTAAGRVTEHPDPFGTVPYGFRRYAAGDPYKHIDWKKTAQTGELVSRTLADDKAREVMITLPGDASERAISRAASLAAHCAGSAVPVALRGPGVRIDAGHGERHLRAILTALALWEDRASVNEAVNGFSGLVVHVSSDGRFSMNGNGDGYE